MANEQQPDLDLKQQQELPLVREQVNHSARTADSDSGVAASRLQHLCAGALLQNEAARAEDPDAVPVWVSSGWRLVSLHSAPLVCSGTYKQGMASGN